MKRILSIAFMLLFMALTIIIGGGIAGLASFWDAPSMLVVVAIAVPMLIFSDNFPDFIRAFDIAITKHDYTTKEIECSEQAMGLAIRLIFLTGIFGFFTGFINMLGHISEPSMIGPSAAIALLTVYYSIIINIFFYAVQAKVKKELIYRNK